MTKLQLLHRALNERLMAAVEQIMEMVGGTVLEYEEETIRARKENEVLRRRLRWMEGANRADWPGPSQPASTTDEANPSRQDEGDVSFGFGLESEALVIKTEATDTPLCSVTALPQSIDQGPDNAGTGAGIAFGMVDSMTWDSAQNYMAPLDFDPTSGPSRVRLWRSQNRRQRMSFACPDCGKVFSSKQRLMVHMRIHSTERPYAYRRRKACFYGDNKKKRKLHRLSQLSREIVDDLSDGSEQTNRSSASPETTAPGNKEEPESDHTSSDKEPAKRITSPVRNQRGKKRVVNQMCRCPHCPQRVFARPCQLAMHMKTHTVTALVNLPSQAQSGTQEIVDVNRRLPKRQRKIDVEKKPKNEFHCPDCSKVFFHASRLRIHMKSHKAKKDLLHTTQQYQTELTKEPMVAVPKTTEVTNVKEVKKTYACPHCNKVFAREGWLIPHIRSRHREVKNRSDYFNVYGSGRTRSQQLVTKRSRKHRAQKWEAIKKMRLSSQKTKGLRKVKAKPSQTSDESFLVVDVPTFTKDGDEESTDLPILASEEAEENDDHSVMGRDEAEESEDLIKTSTDEAQQSADLPKKDTDEAQQSADLPKKDTDEAQQSADLPKKDTDEAQQSADLPKMGTDEPLSISEPSNDISGSDCCTSNTKHPKTMFPCKTCGKDFVLEKKLKKHLRKHIGRRLQDERKRKRERAGMEVEEQEKTKWEGKKRLDDEISTSNHNPNTTQTSHGSPKKESLRKSRNRGQGPLPCPFCGKVFAWEMRLMMHMQIHCGEKPYAYRQRKKRFYGDLKRGQLPKIHNQEPSGDKSDSEEPASEEMVNKGSSAHLSNASNATYAVSGAHASSTAIEQPTTSSKNILKSKTALSSDTTSHFSMQPRIILQPIMTACKYWSSLPGVTDLKAGSPEKSSGFDHEPTTSVQVDDETVEDEIVDSNLCTLPVKFSGRDIQNKPEIFYNETEIVCVKVGSPQRDCEVEHDNIKGSLAFESTEGNNAKSQQKVDDCNLHFSDVSENTTRDQVSVILIDDELQQSNERTAAENAVSECGRTKCDYVEDNIDEDVSSPSKALDKKKTTSGPSIQNEQLEVGSTSGKIPSSDSNCPASDATESSQSTDGASRHTDGQSLSNDSVRDQMAFTGIRQTEDKPTSSEQRISCQTSDMVFAGQESLSDINTDKELLDRETVCISERKNNKLGLDNQGPECQTNSTDENSNINHCCYCKQPHHRMLDHLQSVHPNEPEVAKAFSFDKSSQERKQLLNLLQARGNILHNTNEIQSSKLDTKPFEKFASDSSFDDSVYCIYCLGLFNKTFFASHLEQCKGKSTHSAEACCGEMLPNARPIPPTSTLIFPSSPEIDANMEPSGFHCLNAFDFENEQGCSSLPDLSSPNEEYRNNKQAEGPILQFRCFSENEVSYELRSGSYSNPSTGQESTDFRNEVTLPKCDVDQERAITQTSDSSYIGLHPEYCFLRKEDPSNDFSPPHSAQTVCNNTPKSSGKAQTYGTGKKRRRKRRSHVHNRSQVLVDDLLDEGEMSNSKLHVCQYCKATFGSPYTLRRHEYTHTGERPFWCHQCNVGFIQKYRFLKHTFACHGDTPDQEKLKRAKRSIQDEVMSVRDEASIEPATKSVEDLPNAVLDDTGKKVDTRQDTEVGEIHWEEAGHSAVQDYDVDC